MRYRDILAAYAAGVAMNGFLPANIGTIVSLLMYVALIRGSTFAGVLGATVRPEDLLHGDRRVRLSLPLPLRSGHVRPRSSGIVSDHRLLVPLLIVGADRPGLPAGEEVLEQDREALGACEAGRRDPLQQARLRGQGAAPVVRLVAREARRDRRLSRRLQHPGDLPHDHVGDGWQLAREHACRSRREVSASRRP